MMRDNKDTEIIGRLPLYDSYGGHNVVYSIGGKSPTILLNASKGYPPLIMVEGSP